VYFLVVKVAGV